MTGNDSSLLSHAETLLNGGRAGDVVELVRQRLQQGFEVDVRQVALLRARLAGLLIDAGGEGGIESAILDGIAIYEGERGTLKRYVADSSIEYNLGNAKDGLFKLHRSQPGFRFTPESIGLLTEAKNHFWRAYKLTSGSETEFRLRLLTNLANALDTSGRVVEALQLCDAALKIDPQFPMASAARASALVWLNSLSGTYTVNLLQQAIQGFETAARSACLPQAVRSECLARAQTLRSRTIELGHSSDTDPHDAGDTTREEAGHSLYRKFCLANGLTLSEHSLYCHCAASARDDIMIPHRNRSVAGIPTSRMEHLLNRLKSEFAFARMLYFSSLPETAPEWRTLDREMLLSDLLDGEVVGTAAEMLRTAFRLCFGILDKIARGVCNQFGLADAGEPVYFESFWRNREERWDKINALQSSPLLALFSQATDLNVRNGEWGFYKEWRNALEHNLLVVTTEDAPPLVSSDN